MCRLNHTITSHPILGIVYVLHIILLGSWASQNRYRLFIHQLGLQCAAVIGLVQNPQM